MDVYTTWCAPCRRLDEEVFISPVVEAAAAGMIAVKVDAESGDGPALVRRYRVVGYPTVLVLDSSGEERGRIFGYVDADEFAATLRAIRYGTGSFVAPMAAIAAAARPGTIIPTAFDHGFQAATCGDFERADTLLNGVVAADNYNGLGYAARALLALGKYRYLRGAEDYDAAIATFATLRERFRDTPEADEALIQTGIAHARAGRADSALAAFEVFVGLDRADVSRVNAVAFSMLLERVHMPRATELATAALGEHPDEHALWDTLAELRFAQGDRAGAVEAIERAIGLDENNAYYGEQRARFAALEDAPR